LIGVFDSGIGGLSVLKALRAELPTEDFIYLADSAHAPYGERDTAHVQARARVITQYLVEQGIRALVVACNTATAGAIDQLRSQHPELTIIGVEPAVKPAVLLSKTGHVGVMATRSTLESARFKDLLALQTVQHPSIRFVLQPCDGLADAIEQSIGDQDTTKVIAACASQIRAMGSFGTETGQIDTLVLGCTHYPLVSHTLQALVGPAVTLVETGEAVARQTRKLLEAAVVYGEAPSAVAGRVRLISTGREQPLQAAAVHWLQLNERVDLL
jgi:glutamate racemase